MARIRSSFLSIALLLLLWPVAGAGERPAEAGVAAKLDRRVSCHLDPRHGRVVQRLEAALGCRIEMDDSFPKERLPFVVARMMSARSVLDWMCTFAGGDWVADAGTIRLLSPQKAWRLHKHPTRRYGLAAQGLGPKEAKELAAFVRHAIGAPSGRRGGRAELEPDGTLAVTAPPVDQLLVRTLLDVLRTLPPDLSLQWHVPDTEGPSSAFLPEGIVPLRDKLEGKTSFDFVETPLQQVFLFLSAKHEVNIVYDIAPLRPAERSVTLRVNDMRLDAAFTWVLKLVGLRRIDTEDAIIITSLNRAVTLERRSVPITIAAHDVSGVLDAGWTRQEVLAFLDLNLGAPDIVPDVTLVGAGERPRGEQWERPDLVALVGTRVLTRPASPRWQGYQEWAVRAMRLPPGRPAPQFVFEGPRRVRLIPGTLKVRPPEHVWRAKLEKALRKRISMDFDRAPLQDVISFISALIDVTMVLDTEAIREEAPTATLYLKDVPVRTAIDYLCLATGIRWVLKDEAFFFSKPDRLWARPAMRMTRIRRIAQTPREAREFARFVESVMRASGSWDEDASWLAARPGYHLQVMGTPAQQKFIKELCRGLVEAQPGQRRALPDPGDPMGESAFVGRLLADRAPAAVLRRLEARAGFDLQNVALSAAVAEIARMAKVTILLEPDRTLRQAKVSLRGQGLRLADALRQVEQQAEAIHLPLQHGLFVVGRRRAPKLRPTPWLLYDVRHVAQDEAGAERILAQLKAPAEKRKAWASAFAARWKRRLVVRSAAAMKGKGSF